MNEEQNILIICKYHGPTNTRGSRISFRLGLPDSKQRFIGYDYELNDETEMVAKHIELKLGIRPLAYVQNKETPSLVYRWNTKLLNFVGLKEIAL